MKSWDLFKMWLANNENHALHDFKELIVSKFKLARSDQTCRCETEDGACEHCRK